MDQRLKRLVGKVDSSLGTSKLPQLVGMLIVCDICQKKYPHVFAGIKTIRRKCQKCSGFYDMCWECVDSVLCPWCSNVDLKY